MKNWKYIEGAKTGNAGITDKEFNSESDMRRWCIEHNYTYTPVGGGYYRLEDDSGKNRNDLEAHVKAGNKTGNEKTGAEEFFKKLSDDVKDREKKDDKDIEKVGNSLIGKTVWVKKSDGHQYKATVLREDGGRVYVNTGDGDQFWRLKHEVEVINKVGNAIGGGVQSETVLTETKDGSQYWVEKTSKSGQYAQYNLYYTIGQGKRHAGVFKDKEAAADAGRRIIGNASSNEEYWKKQYIETARKKGISEKEIQEFVKKIEKEGPKGVMSTVKNSASDDKIVYVMREFDKGKLKTPDGKVVTDPAQAKAIAYSESKKTENGLARARKAMNKGITMWKGNDSAYIKEDGTVSYLENNSFETDKDKFESQESAIKELSKQGYVKK